MSPGGSRSDFAEAAPLDDATGADWRALAESAWEMVGVDVDGAVALARRVTEGTRDAYAISVAHRALGLALLEFADVGESIAQMRRALEAARRCDDPELLAQGEIGLAAALQYGGDRPGALRLAGQAVRRAPAHPRIVMSHAVILERYGLAARALAAYDRAAELAAAAGDPHALAKALSNRALARIDAAELDRAEVDLREAAALAVRHGMEHVELLAMANLGYLAGRQGRLVDALAILDDATPRFRRLGGLRLGEHELNRCEALLLAGLAGPARAAAGVAIGAFDAAGAVVERAEAQTLAAEASLSLGDTEHARSMATLAAETFDERGVGTWGALARNLAVRADFRRHPPAPELARRAAQVGEALDAAGWATSAAQARILGARIAIAAGRPEEARVQLRLVRDTPRSPVALRIQARTAAALLRRQAGDRRGARAALRSAWGLLERHRATLGATELRAGATAHVAEIVDIAMEMAIEDRRPREVLRWAERGRVGALTPRATAPPDDPELARLLGELRVVAAEADAAAKRGDDSRALLRRQAQIEERVRGRARLLPPEEGGGAAPTIDAAEILVAVGNRALLEYVVSGDDLWVVVGTRGRFALRRVCTVEQVEAEADGLRVALRRLAFGSPVPQLRAAARHGADYARGRLRKLLFDPVADLVGDRQRIIVPMGPLHAVPWSALHEPQEPWVVAPSASLWARAAAAPPRGGGVLLVAGPRLAEARAEIGAIATAHGTAGLRGDGSTAADAVILAGADATVDAVREAMHGAALAHLACHGRFRADNPLFSSLELHDGALSVFELERLGRAPTQILLSACDAGLSAVHAGDELLGLAAALLRLGTTGIVASVLPVPDGATRRLMEAVHQQLAAGAGLAEALAAARASLDPERDDDLVAGWAFQVLGAG